MTGRPGNQLHFLEDPTPMRLRPAAAAILVTVDGRYVLQLRDDTPGIPYPGHWACFGGALEDGEDPPAALVRELAEETGLAFALAELSYFTTSTFDYAFAAGPMLTRTYFTVTMDDARLAAVRLTEGRNWAALSPGEVFGEIRLAPYDGFVLWMHASRRRFHW
ncbi:NUDIX domain-containing protein [Magnetospirillum sp. UT-4]|uniref:NUDIX domain-containing protein n=1 Tax=Magnetospirillum sp. UT-4 TaxID=2681467 RepID=UPI00137C9A27|nr:NUDIX domain-containing protein [Magnetospirillum sp. UT-4]CAA7612096.1 putative NUDIX hydrolase [Magnetospirillum sp. UT-4]